MYVCMYGYVCLVELKNVSQVFFFWFPLHSSRGFGGELMRPAGVFVRLSVIINHNLHLHLILVFKYLVCQVKHDVSRN